MAYQALYRTYRPQLFREVVGQEVIVKTLQNAIANNKISHAYLFSGPRGTGKTTVARIFAKTLNCENPTLQEPCDKCHSCYEIADGTSPDVIEIDAASNNGVDEIRDIREKAKFLPSGTKYKIYIIDEVHMLSTGAFNALLKTLEEPPAHVVFILATTEAQKIPSTIASRCQRFEFKSLTVSEISKKLRLVCNDENVEISEEALTSISESAEGALRDALSVLDQAISYADEKVTIEDVNLVTGSLSYDKMIELAASFEERNVTNALEIVHALIESGKEVDKIVSGLLQFYRDMLLYKNVSSAVYAKYIFEKPKFKELVEHIDDNRIFYYVEILSDVQNKIKYSTAPHIYLEIALIKMINMSEMSLNYLDRINDLENRLADVEENGVNVSGAVSSEVDNDKVNANETKINRVISELSKLELPKLIQRVGDLENRPVAASNGEVTFDNGVVNELKNEVEGLQESVQILKASNTTLKNQVEQIASKAQTADLTEINSRIEALEARKTSIDYSGDIAYLKEDLDSVKLAINTLINKSKTVDPELASKVEYLERKLLEVIASQNNRYNPEPRKPKASDTPVMVRGEDVQPINEPKRTSEVNVNFGSLAKDTYSDSASNSRKIIEDERNASHPAVIQEASSIDYNYHDSDASIIRNEQLSGNYVQNRKTPKVEVQQKQEPIEEVKANTTEEEHYNEIDKVNMTMVMANEEQSNAQPDLFGGVYDFGEENQEKSEELTAQEQDVSDDLENEEVIEEPSVEPQEEIVEDSEEVEEPIEETIEEQPEEVIEETNVEEQPEPEVEQIISVNADEDESDDEQVEYEEDDEESVIEEKPVYKPANVVEEKVETIKPTTSSSDIIRSEKEAEEPLNISKEQVRESYQTVRPITNEASGEPFASYDVKYVEKVLNESRTESARNDLQRVKRVWDIIGNNTNPSLTGVINVLKQGYIAAVGNREFILVFKTSSLCNQTMKTEFKKNADQVFKTYLNEKYNYISLPENIWLEKRSEYINIYKTGIKFPKLTPINDPSLIIIRPDQEYKDPTEKIKENALAKFGSKITFEDQ